MSLVHTFTNVRMSSGPNRDIELWVYGTNTNTTAGRWKLRDAISAEDILLDDVHPSERGSRRSELQAAMNTFFGFQVNLRDLLSRPPDGSPALDAWPYTWDVA